MRKEGNNPYNNKVYVDYDHKTIRFIPVGVRGVIKYYVMFLGNILMFYFMCFLFPLMYIIWVVGTLLDFTPGTLNALVLYSSLQLFLIGIYFSLWFFRKSWRKKHFPELNYKISSNLIFGIKKFNRVKIKEINNESLINNKIIIPYFSNVMMEYKAKKDFGKQLKSIKIINIFKADPFKFFCVFEFRKKPKDGSLWVKYL